MKLNEASIPSYELMHRGDRVDFAFRSMEEIHAKFGNVKDLPHRHNYYTILWANNACGEHHIDYSKHYIKPNLVFFVDPGQVHQVITFGRPEGYVIMFTNEYLAHNQISNKFITNLGLFSCSASTPPLTVPDDMKLKLKEYAENMKLAFYSSDKFKHETISSFLKLFLIECNKIAPEPNSENPQLLQSNRNIIVKFKSEVENNFTKKHKVSEYADALHLTADYLNDVVKSAVGKTAKEFIQERITLEAKRIGLHTSLSSKEIAWQLGFEDPSHFSKFFKNIEGLSFSGFRKSIVSEQRA